MQESNYEKLSDIEHVFKRSEMYMGSLDQITINDWALSGDSGEEMEIQELTYVPGFLKIFQEVLDNARDESIRNDKVTQIKVNVNEDHIVVWNNGSGILIEESKKHKMWIPSLIFGEFRSGSNFDDTQERVVGGLNGLGVKLTNVFSTKFIVETCDGNHKFTQTFEKNMSIKGKPKITKAGKTAPFTRITFYPDIAKFKDVSVEDMFPLFQKAVYDVSATTDKRVSVYFNDSVIKIKTFEKYIDLYVGNKKESPRFFFKDDKWQVGVALNQVGSMQQVSFVNGIYTSQGGTHVTHVANQLTTKIKTILEAKKGNKNLKMTETSIKNNLFIFISVSLDKPNFNSQTKETLITKITKNNGTDIAIEPIKKWIKASGLEDRLVSASQLKEQQELKKISSTSKRARITGYDKLEDANWAGTAKSKECTLFLVEGDSARTFAISGFSIVGNDRYGVFPVRGKLLNVRDASLSKIMANAEVVAIGKIVGLQYGKKYQNVNGLRYGKICILTDADDDGYHIKGLIINFIHHFWPELIALNFVCAMSTPVVKATKGKQVLTFNNALDFKTWSQKVNTNLWYIKHYKGLGTSTPAEAKENFKNLSGQLTIYQADKEIDQYMKLAFSADKADQRKDWLRAYDKNKIEMAGGVREKMKVSTFIDSELILFSMADNIRSIPNVIDGLKPSQRKILDYCLRRTNFDNKKAQMKVSELSGYISAEEEYHHGEASLHGAIIKMAQNFVGSNNFNFLVPEGQFGSRLQGGDDAGSARYLHTFLNKETKIIFDPADYSLLEKVVDCGKTIEPEFFVPTVPIVLINGSEGIGTGFSTKCPSYNIKDVIANLKRLLAGQESTEMIPWYRGFTGTIQKVDQHKYQSVGVWIKKNKNTITITELPVKSWTTAYKSFLESLLSDGVVTDITDMITDDTVNFTVTFKENLLQELIDNGQVESFMKLTSNILTSNINLFFKNSSGQTQIKKYQNAEEILKDFFEVRLAFYSKRRKAMIDKISQELDLLANKIRFIQEIIEEKIVIFRKKKDLIVKILEERKYLKVDNNYDYLLDIKIHFFTAEKIEELSLLENKKITELEDLRKKTDKDLWLNDLAKIE